MIIQDDTDYVKMEDKLLSDGASQKSEDPTPKKCSSNLNMLSAFLHLGSDTMRYYNCTRIILKFVKNSLNLIEN